VSAPQLQLGVTLPQFTSGPEAVVDAIHRAEAAGLDSAWVFDHLWPLSGGKERPVLEAWTTLAYLAQKTERIRIGTLVTRSTLRNARLLAHMAATVGALAPGRLVVALGSGDARSRAENAAFGFPYERGDRRHAQLAATVAVLLEGVREAAAPVPEVWVGGRSQALLELAGGVADGWNGWGGGVAQLASDVATVRAAAGTRAVELSWGGIVVLGRDDAEAATLPGPRGGDDHISGGPERVAAALAERAETGVSHLIVTFPDAARRPVYELLAREVRPLLERGRAPAPAQADQARSGRGIKAGP
jgi:alkanesulfonate monooxygenase SsuD/methylene tetrahydromethanopterin reductase-like flavin-dependent oxidoreductase (luciferase family)